MIFRGSGARESLICVRTSNTIDKGQLSIVINHRAKDLALSTSLRRGGGFELRIESVSFNAAMIHQQSLDRQRRYIEVFRYVLLAFHGVVASQHLIDR